MLMGRGIGYVDLHLLASSLLSENTLLWTRDMRLNKIADELKTHGCFMTVQRLRDSC